MKNKTEVEFVAVGQRPDGGLQPLGNLKGTPSLGKNELRGAVQLTVQY